MCYISKILKNESNSQQEGSSLVFKLCCVISQRYWKMKAIHNKPNKFRTSVFVVLYLKDTEKWKQFTTIHKDETYIEMLCYISKILKNESNSQLKNSSNHPQRRCVISQRYWKMKAIHNSRCLLSWSRFVVLYLKDTEKWKQFTTSTFWTWTDSKLCYISKILKNESNSQLNAQGEIYSCRCVISQRYWKMKAIHNCLRQ